MPADATPPLTLEEAVVQLNRIAATCTADDWDGQGTPAITPAAVATARAILTSSRGDVVFWPSPTLDGGLSLTACGSAIIAHVEIEPDGRSRIMVAERGITGQWVGFATPAPPADTPSPNHA